MEKKGKRSNKTKRVVFDFIDVIISTSLQINFQVNEWFFGKKAEKVNEKTCFV